MRTPVSWTASRSGFADGEIERPTLTWVSEPIHQGFFVYRIPNVHRRPGHEIEAVVGLDADGRVVVDATPPGAEELREVPPDAVVAERNERARVSTRLGEAVIWEAPTRYEGRCAWLELPGHVVPVVPCMAQGYRYGSFAVRFVPTADNVLIVGWVEKRYARVEVQFADGSKLGLEPRSGFILGELPTANLVRGREAVAVVGRDATGSRATSANSRAGGVWQSALLRAVTEARLSVTAVERGSPQREAEPHHSESAQVLSTRIAGWWPRPRGQEKRTRSEAALFS